MGSSLYLPKYKSSETYSGWQVFSVEANHKGEFCYWIKRPNMLINGQGLYCLVSENEFDKMVAN